MKLAAVLALLSGLYIYNMPFSISDGDSAEFLTLALTGGIAHPPGYPLYSFLLYLTGRLHQVVSVLVLAPVLSMLFSLGAAALFCQALLLAMREKKWAYLFTLGTFSSPFVWRVAPAVEPFALGLLTASLGLFAVALLEKTTRFKTGFFLLGLSFGLGFVNHHTMALLLPLLLGAVFSLWRRGIREEMPWLPAGFLCGCLPLALIPWLISLPQAVVWGDWQNFSAALWRHLLRQDYGMFRLAALGSEASYATDLFYFFERTLELVPVAFIVVMKLLIYRLPSHSKKNVGPLEAPLLFYGSLLSFAMFLFVFLPLCRLTPTPTTAMILERFFALGCLLAAVPLALLCEWGNPLSKKMAVFVACALLGLAYFNGRYASHGNNQTIGIYMEDTVRTLPERAVVLVEGDHEIWGLELYKRLARRSDMVVVSPVMWQASWYKKRVLSQLPVELQNPSATLAEIMQRAQEMGLPLFTTTVVYDQLESFLQHSYPIGSLIHLVPPQVPVPDARRLYEQNAELLKHLRVPEPQDIAAMSPDARDLFCRYTRTWQALRNALQEHDAVQEVQVVEGWLKRDFCRKVFR